MRGGVWHVRCVPLPKILIKLMSIRHPSQHSLWSLLSSICNTATNDTKTFGFFTQKKQKNLSLDTYEETDVPLVTMLLNTHSLSSVSRTNIQYCNMINSY